jgi:cytochrome c oxidase cbb3-type subunit I/II
MENPRSMSPGSLMPTYPWLLENKLDDSSLEVKISAMRTLGVPYAEGYEQVARTEMNQQAEKITNDLLDNGIVAEPDREIIALIAYLQRLGTDIKAEVAETK